MGDSQSCNNTTQVNSSDGVNESTPETTNEPNYYRYIKNKQLEDPTLPIEEESGYTCDPSDCTCTSTNQKILFPIPPCAQIPDTENDDKHSQLPSEHSDPTFKEIDNALEKYYTGLNISNYRDMYGNSIFLNYIKTEELDDPTLSIEEELGDTCDPNNCTYTWMNQNTLFPIPPYAQIPDTEKDAYMFYILQYCYKHSQPPTDQYIKDTIVPKCNGTIHIPSNPKFKEIDNALAQYYTRLNISNYCGIFLNYIKTEELDDPTLSIEEELGD
eukprot:233858_1